MICPWCGKMTDNHLLDVHGYTYKGESVYAFTRWLCDNCGKSFKVKQKFDFNDFEYVKEEGMKYIQGNESEEYISEWR